MNEARQAIFSAIARNKKADPAGDSEKAHTLPRQVLLPSQQLLALFEKMVVASAATIEHIGGLNELPAAVGQFLSDDRRQTANQRLYLNSPLLMSLDWIPLSTIGFDASADKAFFNSDVSVAGAFCGIAETGSVVLLSEPDVSSAAYFLPKTLIIALAKNKIVPAQESAWINIQTACTELPRTVTLVTGPSRTGDIEQKMILGAHGPKEVHLVLYDH